MEGRDVGSVTNPRYHLFLTTKYLRPGARLSSRVWWRGLARPRHVVAVFDDRAVRVSRACFARVCCGALTRTRAIIVSC